MENGFALTALSFLPDVYFLHMFICYKTIITEKVCISTFNHIHCFNSKLKMNDGKKYFNMHVHTLPDLLDSQAALSNSYPNACVPSKEAICAIFMMVFGMTWLGREPMTYRMRGRHANH